MTRTFGAGGLFLLSALVIGLLASAPVGGGLVLGSSAASTASSPVTGAITGPTYVGFTLHATYQVTASGGPAQLSNGTTVGNYTYHASLSGTNTTNADITPPRGVLVNHAVNLTLIAPNVTETITLHVEVSSLSGKLNSSTNLTYIVNIVQPYVLSATLVASAGVNVLAFSVQVLLDGSPVGTVAVPTITAGGSYPLKFDYVTAGLSSGDHMFSISLVQQHGLVTFVGGATLYSVTIYVVGPPANNTTYFALGAAAFAGALFILVTGVAARRRNRPKK